MQNQQRLVYSRKGIFLSLLLCIYAPLIQCKHFSWPDEAAVNGKSASSSASVFAVASTSPAGGATGVANNSTITVNLTLPANTGTLSYAATTGACTGSVQMSADSFATCVGFSGHAWNGAQNAVVLTLSSALAFSTTYQIKVTTALQGAGAETLAAVFTSAGFTTSASPPLTISSVSPADATANVAFGTTITINFSAMMNTGTLAVNNSLGACAGSLQVSSDNFSTCIGLISPTWNGSFNQLTVTPAVSLGPGQQYKIKVTTALIGTGGEVLTTDYVTATGFSTTIVAPTALQAFSSDTRNMLVWQAAAGAANYNIYFSTTAGVTTGTGTLISGVNAPYTHTGLSNGVTYYYIVTGVNGAIIGQASAQASAAPVAFKTIFVTSVNYTGNLGGIAGGDTNCVTRAGAVPLSGQFRAYLSDATHDAACRILGLTGKLASNCGLPVAPDLTVIGPYMNRNAQIVATSLQALISNSLISPVGFQETGTSAGGATPFTGTANGVQSGLNCSDWTDGSALSSGGIGNSTSTTSQWSSNGTGTCSVIITLIPIAPIYCVQY